MLVAMRRARLHILRTPLMKARRRLRRGHWRLAVNAVRRLVCGDWRLSARAGTTIGPRVRSLLIAIDDGMLASSIFSFTTICPPANDDSMHLLGNIVRAEDVKKPREQESLLDARENLFDTVALRRLLQRWRWLGL